jgi:adenylosuccinate synthase
VLVRQSVKTINGIDGIALTKLDVLDGFKRSSLRRLQARRRSRHLPAGQRDQAAVEPVYETIAGWTESTAGARSFMGRPAGNRPSNMSAASRN